MRLICPNCGAQYEVPDSVIPETGRDVQCSSCGHTWFQRHAQQDSVAQDEAGQTAWDDEDDEDDQSLFAETDADRDPPRDTPAPAAQPAPPRPEAQPAREAQPMREAQTPPAPTATATKATDDAHDDAHEDEWEGFPTDPGLTDAPRPGTTLVPDPEDPISRLPDVDEDDYEEDPARDLPTPRRSLDTSVADLLREEAEREARARAAERGPGLESQPDLGLDSAPSRPMGQDSDALRRAEEARLRMIRLRGEAEASPAPAQPQPQTRPLTQPQTQTPPPAPQSVAASRRTDADDDRITAAAAAALADSRRALLPDIEEINSSLRSTSDRRPARADDHDTPGHYTDPRQVTVDEPRGFNRGFSVTFLLAMILLALYIFAPALAEAVPAAAPAMDAYVAAVDALRVMLDTQFQKLSLWLADIAGSTG